MRNILLTLILTLSIFYTTIAKSSNHKVFGKADSNNDRKITNAELEKYLNTKISQKASELGRSQNSQLVGHPNDNYAQKVLMIYK